MKRSRRPWVAPRDGGYHPTEPTTGPASPSGVGSANTSPSDAEIIDSLIGKGEATPAVAELIDSLGEPPRRPSLRERRFQRSREWLAAHGRIISNGMADGYEPPSASMNPTVGGIKPASAQFVGEQHTEPQHITARSMLRSIECLSAALTASGVAVDSVVQSARRGAEEGLRRRLGGHEQR